nr:hypothetical protein [Tanacetum cinerariifolium]
VIEFGDFYEAPQEVSDTGLTSKGSAKKKGRTVAVTTNDIQKRWNDVKARTTLLMAIPDEHQLKFSKYKTAQELWAAILKTFEGKETLEQTFNRLQAIVSHLKFMDVEIEKDDLNQKFLTSLAPEWLIFWKKTGKKITIQGTDVVGFDKSKVEYFNCHKIGHFARECMAPTSQDRGRREIYKQGSKEEEQAPKALMAIDGVGWDWSYVANKEENHALVADEETPIEFALMAKSSSENKTFGGNKATKKTKKNQLKQQYGNFKAEGKETPKQTFNRLQAIVSHLKFIDVEIEEDDLNQKFLTSLAPEWLMYTIVWRNRSDLDTMSLDDLYNHLKVYEPEVQKKSESNSQNNMGLLSIRADRFWKKTGKKITIQGTDVAGFDKSQVEYFNCHKIGHFARDCMEPTSQDRGRREIYKQGSKEEEQAPKALMAIDGVGWDWSYVANKEENHALVADEETPTEFALMAKSSSENKELEELKKEKKGLDSKLAGFQLAFKDLDTLLGSQRSDKNKEGLGYSAVPPSCSSLLSSQERHVLDMIA